MAPPFNKRSVSNSFAILKIIYVTLILHFSLSIEKKLYDTQSVNGITGCRIFRTGRCLQNVNIKNTNTKIGKIPAILWTEILLQTGSSSSRIPGGNQ